MDKTRQHHVPQFYLRRFANDDEQLWLLDAQTRKPPVRTGVANVGAIRGSDDAVRDGFFQEHEKSVAPILASLVPRLEAGKPDRLTREEQLTLAVFLSVQLGRHPDLWSTDGSRAQRLGLEELPAIAFPLATHLFGLAWQFTRANRDDAFFTSDMPVGIHGSDTPAEAAVKLDGLAPGVGVSCALSPRVLVSVTNSDGERGSYMEADDAEIDRLNRLRLIGMKRFVFCSSQSSATWVLNAWRAANISTT